MNFVEEIGGYILLKIGWKCDISSASYGPFQHVKRVVCCHIATCTTVTAFNYRRQMPFQCQPATAKQIVKNELCWRNQGLQFGCFRIEIGPSVGRLSATFPRGATSRTCENRHTKSLDEFKAKRSRSLTRNDQIDIEKIANQRWITTETRTKETR